MKLSLSRVIQINRGIQALDAGHEMTVDGKSARRPFRYGATVHFPLQQNAAALRPHVEAFTKASQALFAAVAEPYTNDKGEPSQRCPADQLADYNRQVEQLLEQQVQAKLFRIKLSELKVGTGEGENPISLQAITDLRPILLDDMPRDGLVEVTDEAAPAAEG